MTQRADLRASDAEREQVAERLRRAAVEGRLGADELDDRLGAALSARTFGELDVLIADLPVTEVARHRPSSPSARPRPAHPVALASAVVVALILLLSALGNSLGGHAHGHMVAGGPGLGAPLVWLVAVALVWRHVARRRHGER
jgi:hypothetical protein